MWKKAMIALLIGAALFYQGGSSVPLNANGEVFLYRAVEKVEPGHFPLNQKNLGSCVAFGHAAGCDVLLAIDVVMGKATKFMRASPDSMYGGMRNEAYGRTSHSYADGSNGRAATTWLKNYGVIYQQPYSVTYKDGTRETINLTTYDVNRTREWGALGNGGRKDGINGPFDMEAKRHPIKDAVLVRTLEELVAALKNGFPVTICSGQGFTTTRDRDGFCRPSGSWSHCMVIVGMRLDSRPGFLILNSWGNSWVSGPKYLDQPDGSFYAEPYVVARILKAGDSYALSGQTGFEKKLLPFWMTEATAQVPYDEEVDNDADQAVESERKPYLGTDGKWYFIDDRGRVLRWDERQKAWLYCDGKSCERVTSILARAFYERIA